MSKQGISSEPSSQEKRKFLSIKEWLCFTKKLTVRNFFKEENIGRGKWFLFVISVPKQKKRLSFKKRFFKKKKKQVIIFFRILASQMEGCEAMLLITQLIMPKSQNDANIAINRHLHEQVRYYVHFRCIISSCLLREIYILCSKRMFKQFDMV